MTKLLTITEAAPLLGKTPNGVRELIERSRRAAAGRPVKGSTIRFCQDGRWGRILFRREWIEDYLESITIAPQELVVGKPGSRRRCRRPELSWDDC